MTNRIDSIWKKIDVRAPDKCWVWLGSKNHGKRGGGYGRIDMLGLKGVYVHRAAYLHANPGAITLDKRDGQLVLHRCDNPACCNPAHLYVGTHEQNMRDKVERKRTPDYRGVRGPRSKLTEEDVLDIRAKKKAGATKKALAMLYGVSEATISGACYGRHYRDIT